MRNLVLILLFTVGMYVPAANAQSMGSNQLSRHSVAIGYNDVNAGRNLAITYHYNFKKDWNIYGGLKFFINSNSYKNAINIYSPYFKQLYVRDIGNSIGAKFGLEKTIVHFNKNCELYGFYDFQFTKAYAKSVSKLWAWGIPPHEEDFLFQINAVENTVGLGTSIHIDDHLKLKMFAGLGWVYFKADQIAPTAVVDPAYNAGAINRMFGLSLNYTFGGSTVADPSTQKKKYKKYKSQKHNSLYIQYDDVQTGRNFNVSYGYALSENVTVLGGLKYQMGGRFNDDYLKMESEKSYYFKQFQPQTFAQRIGLKAGIEYSYKIPHTDMDVFGFYNLQLMRCDVKNLIGLENFMTPDYDREGEGYFLAKLTGSGSFAESVASYRTYGPVIALENYVGLGIKLKCTDQINLQLQGGIGYNFYLGPDTYQPYDIINFTQSKHFENVPWTATKSEVSRMFSIGLEYKIKRRD